MNKKNSGVVLIKTIIAISILALTLTVSVRLIGVSAKNIQQNRKRTHALYYAQQCLEWTRNIRDTAWKQSIPWDCAFTPGTDQSIQKSSSTISSCSSTAKFGYELPSYTDANGVIADTVFSRKIVTTEPSTGQLEVKCEVAWSAKPKDRVSLSHILTNWKR